MTDLNNEFGPGQPDPAPSAPKTNKTRRPNFIAVGVGASDGGVEAFMEFLRHLPPLTGVAIVLALHLDPEQESGLPELLSGKTAMPVLQVRNGAPLKPGHVYVIPPNTLISIDDLTLRLEPRQSVEGSFRPVDTFFHSLAGEFQHNAIGVVLSGTATDGTWGLQAIKAAGGITFAQNQTAKFDGMPRHAIAAGIVDFVLSPQRIAERLTAIADRSHTATAMWKGDAITLKQVLLLLRQNTGVDFAQYKQPTILRRLNRRILLRNAESPEEYLAILRKEPAEIKALFDDLLINVTGFFRDPGPFEVVARLVIPSLIRNLKSSSSLRIWVPGCSSGEEVYSLAISLFEFLEAETEAEDRTFTVQIFGTDIREGAIAKARTATYDLGGHPKPANGGHLKTGQ